MAVSTQETLWVLLAQSDDREALEQLLRSVQPSLLRYLRRVVGPDDAEDVLQEVLLLVYRNLQWLENPEVFRSWSFRIASRAAFRHLRKRHRLLADREYGDEQIENAPAPDVRPPSELLELLGTATFISPASRAVLTLHFQEEMSLNDVAAVLEIPLGTVKSRLAYGLAALRKQFATKGRL